MSLHPRAFSSVTATAASTPIDDARAAHGARLSDRFTSPISRITPAYRLPGHAQQTHAARYAQNETGIAPSGREDGEKRRRRRRLFLDAIIRRRILLTLRVRLRGEMATMPPRMRPGII